MTEDATEVRMMISPRAGVIRQHAYVVNRTSAPPTLTYLGERELRN